MSNEIIMKLIDDVKDDMRMAAESRGKLHKAVTTLMVNRDHDVEKIDEALLILRGDGNGNEGLLQKVRHLEQGQVVMNKKLNRMSEENKERDNKVAEVIAKKAAEKLKLKQTKAQGRYGVWVAIIGAIGLGIAAYFK